MVLKWTRTKPEPLKYFELELNLNPNRYLKRFDTLVVEDSEEVVRYEARLWRKTYADGFVIRTLKLLKIIFITNFALYITADARSALGVKSWLYERILSLV